jgi:type I restriction enzyme M protein
MFSVLGSMAEEGTAHATHMKGARFTIPTPALLAKVVDLLRHPDGGSRRRATSTNTFVEDRDRRSERPVPRHIITDGGDDGAGAERRPGVRHLRLPSRGRRISAENHPKLFQEKRRATIFMRHVCFDFDGTMLRIGSMNMTLHGVDNPTSVTGFASAGACRRSDRYSLVLANPPFAGCSITDDRKGPARDSQDEDRALFMALFLKF